MVWCCWVCVGVGSMLLLLWLILVLVWIWFRWSGCLVFFSRLICVMKGWGWDYGLCGVWLRFWVCWCRCVCFLDVVVVLLLLCFWLVFMMWMLV